ncbi:unnamed protein product [Calypogeia fissa]
MASCALCPSSLPVVGSSGRFFSARAVPHGRRATGLVATWQPSSSSRSSSIFGKSSALWLSSSPRHPLRPGTNFASRNVVLSMAKDDDPLAQLAKDLESIEEFLPDFDELDKDELQQFLDMDLESSLDYETFRHYELMYMIHEKHAEEVQDVIKKVQDFITENKGRIYRLNDWGMRTLAYTIKKANKANYVLMNFEIDSQSVNALNALLEKDERVIRHMVMSQKAAITQDSVPPEEYRTLRDPEDEEDDEDDEEWEEEEGEEDEESELALQRE